MTKILEIVQTVCNTSQNLDNGVSPQEGSSNAKSGRAVPSDTSAQPPQEEESYTDLDHPDG